MPFCVNCQSNQVLVNYFFNDKTAEKKGFFLVSGHLEVVFVRIAINKGHLFDRISFVAVVTGVEGTDSKELVKLIF